MDLTANWIWHRQDGEAYNDLLIARREFKLSKSLRRAVIAATADSEYRLLINGRWVCDGPARGWPDHYYYDEIDVTDLLHPGPNEIRVIAGYHGTGHFHGIPRQAGLLVQLDLNYADQTAERIVTDTAWEAARACGWYSNTPKISCQMGPAEFYDARHEDAVRFDAAKIVCAAHSGPWKDLRRRDVKMLTQKPVFFRSFSAARLLHKHPDARTFCLPWANLLYPGLIQANRRLMPAFAAITVIENPSPISLSVTVLDLRNGRYPVFVDGKPADAAPLRPGRHLLMITPEMNLNHTTDITVTLSAGGSFTFVNPYETACENAWAVLAFEAFKCAETDMAWREHSPRFQACISGYCEAVEKLARIADIETFVRQTAAQRLPLTAGQMFASDSYARFLSRTPDPSGTAAVENPQALLADGKGVVTVRPSDTGDVELVYDLGEQNVGYYSFELEAEAGVQMDIYGVEYITPGGQIQFTDDHRNGMTYITRKGRNRFDSLKRRSGRYLFIRFVNQRAPIVIHRFSLVESTYPVVPQGGFECSDPAFDRVWEISARTLKLCMEDTFTDCPLYEQTLWVGDARNESLMAYTVFGATDIARRCIVLAGQSLERFPMVGCQVPSSWECLLPAWSFLWGISVWDYYWYTGDKAFLAEMWPSVVKNLNGAADCINQDGLFSGDFWNMFDWAAIDQDRKTVLHNSMFMVGAIRAALRCGRELGKSVELDGLRTLEEQLKRAVNRFWQTSRRAYPDSIHDDGTVSGSVSQHTCFLSLLYDIAEPQMKNALLEHILRPSASVVQVGSPFAIFYLYEMLDQYGLYETVIDSIRQSYLPMVAAGATTVWESFAVGTLAHQEFPTRSHCHAWSSAPLYFFNRILLGIRQTSPGCASFEISPCPAGLDWAKGAMATPKGPVTVSWKKQADGTLDIACSAPPGVNYVIKQPQAAPGLFK